MASIQAIAHLSHQSDSLLEALEGSVNLPLANIMAILVTSCG